MSMQHLITSATPRYKKVQRKGRGESSGRGKTSGRGNKGSKARTGKYIKPSYEGGQTEIFRRFPKRGFNNVNFERKYYVVNLGDLAELETKGTIDAVLLADKGLIPDQKLPVKVLANGEFPAGKKITVQAGWYSKTALAKINDAGGSALTAKGEAFAHPKPKKKFVKRVAEPKKKADAAPEAPAAEPAKE